jgi:hypothetical protein
LIQDHEYIEWLIGNRKEKLEKRKGVGHKNIIIKNLSLPEAGTKNLGLSGKGKWLLILSCVYFS